MRFALPLHHDPKVEMLLLGPSRNRSRSISVQRTAPQTTTQISTLKTSCYPVVSQSPPGQISIVPPPFSEKVGEVANERYTLHLRVELIEMLRISQRAVDYATKACESGHYEYAQHVRSGGDRLHYLGHKILIATSKFREAQKPDGAKLVLNESACKIAMALFFICQHAYGVALRAAAFSAYGVYKPSIDLVTMGMRVNSAMRLCVVALMKNRIEHAEQALHQIGIWRCVTAQRNWLQDSLAQPMVAETSYEQSIAISLLKIMDNVHSIALASADSLVSQW